MRQHRASDLWQSVLGELELQVARPVYETFLRETRGVSLEDNVLTVNVPTPFAAEWLERRVYRLIQKSAQKLSGGPIEARFQVNRAPACGSRNGDGNGSSPSETPPPSLSQRYTFSSFVVGPSNHLAYSASQAVAEMPGTSYNPLFIYAGVGLGKTHLLHAIGHQVHQRSLRFVYVTSEQFTNQFVSAIRNRTTEEFRTRYRSAEVLLIDDIQFIAGKEQTQEGFFHTFNDLHNTGRQIVVACDRPPSALSLLEERLRSRFQWGLTVDVQPPDLETRMAIIHAKAHTLGLELDDALTEYLARQVCRNVRELEGLLNRLCAYCSFTDTSPCKDTAERALSDLLHTVPRRASDPELILDTVSNVLSISRDALTGPRRDRRTASARQVAMYILREELNLSFTDIGRLLGSRDHSTVAHAVAKVSHMLPLDPSLRQLILRIQEHLSNHHKPRR